MIVELTMENLSLFDFSFISKAEIEKELVHNPFARIIVYIEDNQVIGYLYYSDIFHRFCG